MSNMSFIILKYDGILLKALIFSIFVFSLAFILILINNFNKYKIKSLFKKDLIKKREKKQKKVSLKKFKFFNNTNSDLSEKTRNILLMSGTKLTLEEFLKISITLFVISLIISYVLFNLLALSIFIAFIFFNIPFFIIHSKKEKNREKLDKDILKFINNCRENSATNSSLREIVKISSNRLENEMLQLHLKEAVSMIEIPIDISLYEISRKFFNRNLQQFASFLERKKEANEDYYSGIDDFLMILNKISKREKKKKEIVRAAVYVYKMLIIFFVSDFVMYWIVDKSMLDFWYTTMGKNLLIMCVILFIIQGILTFFESLK